MASIHASLFLMKQLRQLERLSARLGVLRDRTLVFNIKYKTSFECYRIKLIKRNVDVKNIYKQIKVL